MNSKIENKIEKSNLRLMRDVDPLEKLKMKMVGSIGVKVDHTSQIEDI